MIEYSFSPKTWLLPLDHEDISRYLQSNREHCVIIKPVAGAQGRGISLAKASNFRDPAEPCVVQSYVTRPLLIDGYKFDMRIYVLVTSCDPLRVLIYKEGLCRLCTTLYSAPTEQNIGCAYMHLTNYSVNKHNADFVQNNDTDNEDGSSKRSLSWLWGFLAEQGHDPSAVWSSISDVVVKTLISVQAPLAATFSDCKVDGQNKNPFTCFELLGFDIMLTAALQPVLIEVNHMPSLKTDSTLDMQIKLPLLENILSVLGVTAEERHRHLAYRQAASQMRLYGELFDHNQRKAAVCDSPEDYWRRYLLSERRNIGDFQLIYPTNSYAHQPTRGRQDVYDRLLAEAAVVFESTRYTVSGSGVNGGDDDLDDDSPPLSSSNSSKSSPRLRNSRTNSSSSLLHVSENYSQFNGSGSLSPLSYRDASAVGPANLADSNRARHVQMVIARSNQLLSSGVMGDRMDFSASSSPLGSRQGEGRFPSVVETSVTAPAPSSVSLGPPRTADVTRTSTELRDELAGLLRSNWALIRTIDEISSVSTGSGRTDEEETISLHDGYSPLSSSKSPPAVSFVPTRPLAALLSPGRNSKATHRKLASKEVDPRDLDQTDQESHVDRCRTAALVQIVRDSRRLTPSFKLLQEEEHSGAYSEDGPLEDYREDKATSHQCSGQSESTETGGGRFDGGDGDDVRRPVSCASTAQSVASDISRTEALYTSAEQSISSPSSAAADRAYEDFMTSVDEMSHQSVSPTPPQRVAQLAPVMLSSSEEIDAAYTQYREYRRQYLLNYRSGQAAST
eukprot:gene25796-32288_t